jgi:molybdopterin-guanine dinucleotide biosynthesis protein A
MTSSEVSGIILAGGKSSRIGQEKAFLRIRGRPLIERTVAELSKVFPEIIIVSNDPTAYQELGASAVVPDIIKGVGPLGGIYTGLQKASNDYGFVVACDMPFLDSRVIRSQVEPLRSAEADAVVPRWDGYLEPLHAIYGKACIPAIKACIEKGARKVIAFYGDVRVRYWDLHPSEEWRRYFRNVNTQAESLGLDNVTEE